MSLNRLLLCIADVVENYSFNYNIPNLLEEASIISKKYNADLNIAKLELNQAEKDILIAESDLKPSGSLSFEAVQTDVDGNESDADTATRLETAESCAHIKVEMRCEVDPGARRGAVAFVGEVNGMPPGWWVGVKFDEPVGKSSGNVKGIQIFECAARYGGFVRGHNIRVGDYPEKDLFDSDEEDDSDDEL